MKAEPLTIAEVFTNRVRYCVPMFQRHYVWSLEKQWQPLWEDIAAKTQARIEQHEKRYPHYMGAVVLENKGTYSTKVVSVCNVIDGQQRLTTLQIVLAAVRDVARLEGFESIYEDAQQYVCNTNPHLMKQPEVEVYKVWPTQFDRDVFKPLISLGSRTKIRHEFSKYFPQNKTRLKLAGYIPPLLEAYIFFHDQITVFIKPDEGDTALTPEDRLEHLYRSFIEDFKLVEITLEDEDDAQVIFETLNDRGTPLLASDLIRNFIFFRAEQGDEDANHLYDKYWSHFEHAFWTEKESQGRLKRARLEFFMAHLIASKTGHEINLTQLFQEYKSFIKSNVPCAAGRDTTEFKHPYENIEQELEDLVGYAPIYKHLVSPSGDDYIAKFARSLSVWDVTTVFPAVFKILRDSCDTTQKSGILSDILSYVVRRGVCGKTSKNYNKVFLNLVKHLQKTGVSQEAVRNFLLSQKGEASNWPSDDEFLASWLTSPIYKLLTPSRIRYLLEEVERQSATNRNEDIQIRSALSIEHVLPQSWTDHWPLSTGEVVSRQMWGEAYLHQYDEDHDLYGKINNRDKALHTIGNLTLLTQPLNASVSNAAYTIKRPLILEQSALALNRYFYNADQWHEKAITSRGENLFAQARVIWPVPQNF